MSVLTEGCTIEVPEQDEVVTHPARIVKAVVVAIDDMTHDIKRVRLQPAKPLEFSAGQYAMLQFTPEHIRPYSMAGLADDKTLEFHVRLVPDGRVTTYISEQLKVGDAVRVSGPLGTAYLRKKHAGPMLCIAGGTGLAPVMAIIRGALSAGMKNPIHVYFGVRSSRDIYALDQLDALSRANSNLHVHVVVALGSTDDVIQDWTLRSGLLTDAVAQDWKNLDGWRAYLCGAPPMVEAAALLVHQKGVLLDHIYADAFYASSN
jgi:ferredoxin-NAD(P)+ reductase (naphthalene dioxygenase ferredoxin-specific)